MFYPECETPQCLVKQSFAHTNPCTRVTTCPVRGMMYPLVLSSGGQLRHSVTATVASTGAMLSYIKAKHMQRMRTADIRRPRAGVPMGAQR